MQSFKDSKDRTWNVQLTLGAVMEIKEQLHVDLLKPEEPAFVEALTDLTAICNMVYLAVKEQADALQIDDREFCNGLDPAAIGALAEAFNEALVSFLQAFRPELGPAVAAIWDKIQTVKTKTGKLAESKVNDPRFDAQIDQQLKEAEEKIDSEIYGTTSAD